VYAKACGKQTISSQRVRNIMGFAELLSAKLVLLRWLKRVHQQVLHIATEWFTYQEQAGLEHELNAVLILFAPAVALDPPLVAHHHRCLYVSTIHLSVLSAASSNIPQQAV
jgi:hypothetical protein